MNRSGSDGDSIGWKDGVHVRSVKRCASRPATPSAGASGASSANGFEAIESSGQSFGVITRVAQQLGNIDCKTCGAEEKLYRGGRCQKCELAVLVDQLLTNPHTGVMAAELVPVTAAGAAAAGAARLWCAGRGDDRG